MKVDGWKNLEQTPGTESPSSPVTSDHVLMPPPPRTGDGGGAKLPSGVSVTRNAGCFDFRV